MSMHSVHQPFTLNSMFQVENVQQNWTSSIEYDEEQHTLENVNSC